MEYYQYLLSVPLLLLGSLSITMFKEYIQVSYIYNKDKNKIN